MKKILVTGATGNVGSAVVRFLCEMDVEREIIAAVRNIERGKNQFKNCKNLSFRTFDFENQETFEAAFKDIDTLFLLRPPHISEVDEFFKPLLLTAKENKVVNIVFLSVQGAEKSSVIPHNKIEQLIKSFGFKYIFVRPSYFMQNLTTTLLPEIQKSRCITLPSGNAKFNWIDVENIGEAAAVLISAFDKNQNSIFELTGTENKNFSEVTALMSEVVGLKFQFKSVNPIRFYFKKRKENIESGFAIVMTILHFLPRLQAEPEKSENFTKLTGKVPTSLRQFIERERYKFESKA